MIPSPAVHTIEAPNPAGDPVVLLHGFASSGAEDWIATGFAEAVAASGRTVHVIDLPGHGASPAVPSAEAGSTSSVVDAILGATSGNVDVVGYSLGARIAWELPQSGRVGRLVLGGLSPFEPFATIDVDELRAVAAGASAPSHPMIGMMAGMISAPGRDTESLANLVAGLGAEPFTPAANPPAVPTLFVAGETDPLAGGIEELVAAVPAAELVRVPGDHHGALASAEFRAAAIAFLG